MLLKDCAYYWNHRILHEYHTLWASHSVHHSGEDYNLSTGLRQGAIQHILSIPFVLPMALLGFPPQAYAAHAQLNTMYQFWVHTDLINRLPFGLEYLMNSPSAHRMHHRPPGNCNYAGVFIIWDRMFGTYVPEKVRQDYYGLAQQPNTFDPVKLNLQHYQKIMKLKKEPRV
jgi:alkylglycerol monooxygenase